MLLCSGVTPGGDLDYILCWGFGSSQPLQGLSPVQSFWSLYPYPLKLVFFFFKPSFSDLQKKEKNCRYTNIY